MFSYEDIEKMYEWDCFTDDQVKKFVPLCITEEEAEQIINKEESTS